MEARDCVAVFVSPSSRWPKESYVNRCVIPKSEYNYPEHSRMKSLEFQQSQVLRNISFVVQEALN